MFHPETLPTFIPQNRHNSLVPKPPPNFIFIRNPHTIKNTPSTFLQDTPTLFRCQVQRGQRVCCDPSRTTFHLPYPDHLFFIAPIFGGLRSWLTGCDKCPDFGLTGEGVIHYPGFGEIGEICPVSDLVGGVVGMGVKPRL